jgi:glycosyltransferase involved in cell wall biosynthesis
VLEALTRQLGQRYEFHILALGLREDQVSPSPLPVYSVGDPTRDPLARGEIRQLVAQIEPRLVLVLSEAWKLRSLLEELRESGETVVIYTPLEGKLVSKEPLAAFASADCCVFYTEFSRRTVADLWQLDNPCPGLGALPPMEVLPHGVDTDVFRPMGGTVEKHFTGPGRMPVRRALFPNRPDLENAFIVFNGNHPYYRKRIDLTIEGFARFAHNKPVDVKLYLHQPRAAPSDQDEALAAMKRFGMADRLLYNSTTPHGDPLPDEQMNLLYNASDVGLNTAMGEGWGLVSFEHGATGAAQVIPDHTSLHEIWNGAAELIRPVRAERLWYDPCEMYVVSPNDIAAALERLYADPDHLHKMSVAAHERATSPRFAWSSISTKLDDILQGVIARAKRGHLEMTPNKEALRAHRTPRATAATDMIAALK